jgi:hypothetical protein
MITKEETSFIYDIPDLDKVPKSLRSELVNEVGDYLVQSILDYVGEAKSPVSGGKYKSKLNPNYAKAMKGGDTLANLDLNGDMLNALTFKADISSGKITVGIFDEEQAIKSYNHNKGDTLPKRQFIPEEDQKLKSEIIRGVNRIISEYLEEED